MEQLDRKITMEKEYLNSIINQVGLTQFHGILLPKTSECTFCTQGTFSSIVEHVFWPQLGQMKNA